VDDDRLLIVLLPVALVVLVDGFALKCNFEGQHSTNSKIISISVEICITLGRMTGSPFSPVHPVPAK
jgi:hypothetical protein